MKKTHKKEFPTSKSRAENIKEALHIATDQMYQIALKSIISSVVPHCPKEILIEISKFINTIYLKLEDHCLNTVMPNDTVKRREIAWEDVTKKVQEVLLPLLQAVNTEQKPLLQVPKVNYTEEPVDYELLPEGSQETTGSNILNHAIKSYAQRRSAEKKSDIQVTSRLNHIYWPKPLEINFLQIKDADDVATISCKVGGITIPYAMIDSGSDSSIVSENVAKHLGLKIDRKKVHRLNGVASKSHSLGTADDVPVTISDAEDSLTISDEFSIVPTEYDDSGKELSLFILGTQWQYRAGWEPLIKGEFKATCNGKTITIPLSVHKSQRNVFTIGKEPEEWFPVEVKKN